MSNHYNQAIEAFQAGQLSIAANKLIQHLQTSPSDADAWHILGIVHYQNNAFDEAITAINKAVKLAPSNTDFLNNYGLVLKANGQTTKAIDAYQQALQKNPKDHDIQLNIANALMECERFEEAAGFYRRLIHQYQRTQPNPEVITALCHALSKMGNQAQQTGNYQQAEACFAEAVALQPSENHLFYNLANAERELGMLDKSAKHYAKSIQLKPNDADAYNNLGNVQREQGHLSLALESYKKALSINPKLHHAKVHLVHQKQHACDWLGLSDEINSVRSLVKNTADAQVSPFAFLAMPETTAAEQLQCANQWINNRFQHLKNTAQSFNISSDTQHHKKINIAYLSADFRLHPLAFLITDLIESHDREKFNIIGYSFGTPDQSKTRQRLVKAFDQFNEIRHLSEADAAKKINADGIDILVDLTGFTQTSRSGIMALRPAKVHVSWLGYAGTMGYLDAQHNIPLFDYLLTDKIVTPPHTAVHYAEALAYLPCYQPNDRHRPVGKNPTRKACNLPDEAFVFCSFNQSFKITPQIFNTWMSILKATKNSVLWLLDCHTIAKQNLITAAKQTGVDPTRLIFAPRVTIEEHLARHAHADLFLDTPTYNAHTTCSDALWMDVPVLTLIGETFASRVAASLLTAVKLPALITNSIEEYEKQAIYYANNADALNQCKSTLISKKAKAILFDTPAFTQALEETYLAML